MVQHRFDLILGEIERIHQEEARVLVRKVHLVLHHLPHGGLPPIEEASVGFLFLPSHMERDLGQSAPEVFISIISKVLGPVHNSLPLLELHPSAVTCQKLHSLKGQLGQIL